MYLIVTIAQLLLAQTGSPVLDAAWARFRREMVIEGAGLFWIAAELAILFAVTVGGRVLRQRPLPERLTLTRGERWLAIGLVACSAGLVALVFGRFLVTPPMPVAIEMAAELDRPEMPRAVYAALSEHTRVHVAIWCAFIAAWVGLETAIVVQGIRAFHALSRLTRVKSFPIPATAASALVLGVFTLWATDVSAQFEHAVEMALQSGYKGALNDAQAGYRFVELYLRVAGTVWVFVEWIAAMYLIRGYWMLRRFFRDRAHVA